MLHLYLSIPDSFSDFRGPGPTHTQLYQIARPSIARMMLELNDLGVNPFMSSVYYGRHLLGIELLMRLEPEGMPFLDVQTRRLVLMQTSTQQSNILHIAASRGNLDFMGLIKEHGMEWGLTRDDLCQMLMAQDVHEARPLDMALFQHHQRGRDRREMVGLLTEWMAELG